MSISKLCEVLVKNGVQIEVFTTTANGNYELDVPINKPIIVDGVHVLYFKRVTKDHSHFSPALLKAVWRRVKQFNIVHIHAWWNVASVLVSLLAILRGVPVVVSPRGTLSDYSFHNKNAFLKNCIHFCLGKLLLNKSFVHATSKHEEKALKLIIKPKQFFTVSNFVNLPLDTFLNRNKFNGTLKMLFFSRVEEKKGLDTLINSLREIKIPYHLTIAGSGEQAYIDYLKSLANRNGSSKNISWIGFRGDDKFAIFASHDLLILPSHDENFGNVVIESLFAGTAVLISEHVGLANYVQQHNLGWICQTTPGSISEHINNIKPAKLEVIKQNAPNIIRRDFNEDNLFQGYLAIYNTIIKNNG